MLKRNCSIDSCSSNYPQAFKRDYNLVRNIRGDIPQDILDLIFREISPKELLITRLVCWDWYLATERDGVWIKQLIYHFQFNEEAAKSLISSLKTRGFSIPLVFMKSFFMLKVGK
jgi:hypothetical protein